MPSSFGWVDFEEKDRQRMMEVVKMFQETDTRDELGIGSIRDTFSDLMFPGSSTIQTRVKYMLFIPWIYLRHEKIKTPSSEIAIKAHNDEVALIYSLLASEDTSGTIGATSKAALQRMASNVYWPGLHVWGIRKFSGSQEEYHRYLDQFYYNKKNLIRGDDREPINGPLRENWDQSLPSLPADFPGKASFELSRAEAEYLVDRLQTSCKGSLLAYLVNNTKPADCQFIWEHPELADFPEYLQKHITHARNFSLTIHGAFLLYNLMLAERSCNQELIDKYQGSIVEWAKSMRNSGFFYKPWNLTEFWEIATSGPYGITTPCRRFVDQWIERVHLNNTPETVMDDINMRKLIESREMVLKRSRARLHNQRALELWSGAAGTGQLSYRWRVVNGMVNDILAGLEKEDNYA